MIGDLFGAGLVIDGILVLIGFFTFVPDQYIFPCWLMAIWPVLATLPNHRLKWLKHRLFFAGVFGAIGGPLAYWAGVRLGAASFNWPLWQSILLLAAVWGLFGPFAMLLSRETGQHTGCPTHLLGQPDQKRC